jgi:glycosyltransferase involved in cell wall biosynthesis
MSRPLVSVVMPTYNRRALLEASIDSVLNQTLDDFELFIVDDASTDGSAEVLGTRARADRRIRIMRAAVNGGCDAARNLAMGQARGRYLAFLDDDDLFLPERLERTVARLEAEPGLGAVFSRFGCIDARGQPLPRTPAFLPVGESATPCDRVFEMLYCDWGWIPTCTLTVRDEQLAGLAFPEFRRCDNDAAFNAQLAASGASFAQLGHTLALVRRDASHASMSLDRKALLADRRASLVFLRSWLGEEGITRFDGLHARAWSNQLIKEAELLGGLRGVGRLILAIGHWPGNRRAWRYTRSRIFASRRRRPLRSTRDRSPSAAGQDPPS